MEAIKSGLEFGIVCDGGWYSRLWSEPLKILTHHPASMIYLGERALSQKDQTE